MSWYHIYYITSVILYIYSGYVTASEYYVSATGQYTTKKKKYNVRSYHYSYTIHVEISLLECTCRGLDDYTVFNSSTTTLALWYSIMLYRLHYDIAQCYIDYTIDYQQDNANFVTQ